MSKYYILLFLIFPTLLFSQDPLEFADEVSKFENDTIRYEVVFTGSSSIRLWETLSEDFPETDLINTGFGGSHMSDLIHYSELLILKYYPEKVFIYEGDNDIFDGEEPQNVYQEAIKMYDLIRNKLPETEIYFISAKPSPSRFHLKNAYETYNTALEKFCESKPITEYIDTWNPMLNGDGVPMPEIFVEDELHMNTDGYKIWKNTIGPYLD